MNILHISLGLPPLRTGGLTRYCTELMEMQVVKGDRVSLVYPGRFLPGGIRFHKSTWHGIETFELINPLPVALTFGVADPKAFITSCSDTEAFKNLLEYLEPDVVHVHSFMGIYRELFQSIKLKGIPLVFTTHDYYPLCPRCTFVDSTGCNCATGANAASCAVCCRGGMTLKKSMVMQSGLYASLKSSKIFKKLSVAVKDDMSTKSLESRESAASDEEIDAYQALLNYNRSVFELFDLVLANSGMAMEIYRSSFPAKEYRLMHISHTGLAVDSSSRFERDAEGPLAIGYFGGKKKYKGYDTLIAAARCLHDAGVKFELRLFGDEYNNLNVPEAQSFGRIAPEKTRGILRALDVVVVPSVCHETFGFVVLEALCEGVPVVCSDAVGASELISPEAIFPAGDVKALAKVLCQFSKSGCLQSRLPAGYPISMSEQVSQLGNVYRLLLRKEVLE